MHLRHSLIGLMTLVVISALCMTVYLDVVKWAPERKKRTAFIKMHEGLAKNYRRELRDPPPVFPMQDDLRKALKELADWHTRRGLELRALGRFDVEAEKVRDLQTTPKPDDEKVREWLGEYRYPRSI